MAESKGAEEIWLPVIGRALAYLCLNQAHQAKPFPDILAKVKFLTDLGLSAADAAYAAGSNPKSVGVMKAQRKARKRGRKK
jgi:hypothetical protein